MVTSSQIKKVRREAKEPSTLHPIRPCEKNFVKEFAQWEGFQSTDDIKNRLEGLDLFRANYDDIHRDIKERSFKLARSREQTARRWETRTNERLKRCDTSNKKLAHTRIKNDMNDPLIRDRPFCPSRIWEVSIILPKTWSYQEKSGRPGEDFYTVTLDWRTISSNPEVLANSPFPALYDFMKTWKRQKDDYDSLMNPNRSSRPNPSGT